MSNITVTIPDTQLIQLKEKATSLGITVVDLVLLSLEEILSRPDEQFNQVAEYILHKNAELYRRLA